MNKTTSKIIAICLAATLCTACLTACKTSAEETTVTTAPATEASDPTDPASQGQNGTAAGGWTVAENAEVTADHKKIVEDAASQIEGFSYEPVRLIATQVVAGTNYCFLCKSTVMAQMGPLDYALCYFNVDPSGNASYLRSNEIVIGNSTKEDLVGGWINTDDCTITDEIKKLTASATSGMTGAEYTPVAYLASQIVSGVNHAVLCQVTPVVPDARPSLVLVYIYDNSNGEISITNTTDLEISAH